MTTQMAEEYDFTEVITFTLPPDTPAGSSLVDKSTSAGKVWASTLKTYLDHEGAGTVYWGLLHGEPHHSKLFIEWKQAAARDAFEASPEAASLRESWQSIVASPVQVASYRWKSASVARETALASSYNTVSALFTWHFGSGANLDGTAWDEAFAPFARDMMRSPVAGMYSYCIYGWQLDRTTFSAVFHCQAVESTREWLETDAVKAQLETLRRTSDSGDPTVEYMEIKKFNQGWCGSVMKERPDNPRLEAMFASFREASGPFAG